MRIKKILFTNREAVLLKKETNDKNKIDVVCYFYLNHLLLCLLLMLISDYKKSHRSYLRC